MYAHDEVLGAIVYRAKLPDVFLRTCHLPCQHTAHVPSATRNPELSPQEIKRKENNDR